MAKMTLGAWRRQKLRLLAVAFLLTLALPAGQALAVQGFGISPTSQTITLAPGEATKGQLTVINDGSTNITYHIYATDYRVAGEAYQGVFTSAGTGKNVSAVSWFGLPKKNIMIPARREMNFPYTIKVPKTAVVGGHYVSVFIETVPPPSNGATIINRIDRIGSLFYLTVSGALVFRGSLLPINVPLLQSDSPIMAGVRLKNTGNVHFLAQGTGQLWSPFGKAGRPMMFRGEVLPNTTRQFSLNLPASSPIGLYNVRVKLSYLGRTADQSHWVLLVPRLTFIIVSATLLLLLGLGFWGLVRRAQRRSRPSK